MSEDVVPYANNPGHGVFPFGSRVRCRIGPGLYVRGRVRGYFSDGRLDVTYDEGQGVNGASGSHAPSALERIDTEPPEPDLPTVGGFVQLPQAWHSSAGIIQNLVEHAVGGVGIIHSRQSSTRAGHHHLTDYHYLACISGRFRYVEWSVDGLHPDKRKREDDHSDVVDLVVGPGQMVFTPPMRNHELTFWTDTVMISISKLNRTHASHEEDVVRL